MKLIHLLPAILLLPVSFLGDGQCRVRVRVSDGVGDFVPSAYVKFVGATTVTGRSDALFRIEPGIYTVEVSAPGATLARLPVVIEQLDQVIAVSLEVGAIEDNVAPTCAVYGHVAGEAEISHVRLLQMFGSKLIDVPLDEKRNFDFRRVGCGDYILVLMARSSCLGTLKVHARYTTGALKIAAQSDTDSCGTLTLER